MSAFISSVGGPHILIETNNLINWGGSKSIGGPASQHAAGAPALNSDYERASHIKGYLGIIPVGKSYGISFWGDRLDLGVKELTPTEALIVRLGTAFTHPFEFAQSLAGKLDQFADDGEIDFYSGKITIIDATDLGQNLTRPSIAFFIQPGRYKILTHVYESDDEDLMVLHILKKTS